MKITYLGHASLQIETGGKTLIIDPFITANEQAGHIDVDDLKADFILITHGHQDHVLDVERIAALNPGVILISNFEIISWFSQKGLQGHAMNHGGQCTFDFGTVKYVTAIHSSVLPDGSYGGNPGGFVIQSDGLTIYIAGDTALTYDMKLIPDMGYKPDLAVLPVGDNFTMGYKEAALASDFVECPKVLGCHYDTFPPIVIDKQKARAHFDSRGKDLLLLEIGQSIDLKERPKKQKV
jgi:L-ascorbate metabolism protein UlaG (beta-lactamase superfamily)